MTKRELNALSPQFPKIGLFLTVFVTVADLNAVSVGVVEIRMAPRKNMVTVVGIFDQSNSTHLQDFHRSVELVSFYQEGVMMRIFVRVIRINVMWNLGENEICATAFHE